MCNVRILKWRFLLCTTDDCVLVTKIHRKVKTFPQANKKQTNNQTSLSDYILTKHYKHLWRNSTRWRHDVTTPPWHFLSLTCKQFQATINYILVATKQSGKLCGYVTCFRFPGPFSVAVCSASAWHLLWRRRFRWRHIRCVWLVLRSAVDGCAGAWLVGRVWRCFRRWCGCLCLSNGFRPVFFRFWAATAVRH